MHKIKQQFTILGLRIYLNTLALFNKEKAGLIAFNIFCTPRKGRLRERDAQFLSTATQEKDLFVKDVNIRCYHWQGPGDTVLLVHGWESNAARWQRLIKQLLARGFNVIALDGPGHGQSGGRQFNVPLYASMMEVVVRHYQPQAIVGHSIGGFASVFLLSQGQYPSVQQLAILGTPAELSKMVAGYQRLVGLSNRVVAGLKGLFEKRFGFTMAHFSGPTLARTLSIPGLIIHDLNDQTVAHADAESYAANWPQARLISTRSQGHRLNGDGVPEAVVSFLLQKEAVA